MELPVDIIDHILSFVVSDPKTLIACSEVPLLSPIVERHLYSTFSVRIGSTNSLPPHQISEVFSTHPHISHYVRVLKINADFNRDVDNDQIVTQLLDEFANTLLMFPALECISLSPNRGGWRWPTAFQAALEDRLKLPTVKEVHFDGSRDFPFSLLDCCKNIKNLSLSGIFSMDQFCASTSTLPQLKSLTLDSPMISASFMAWIKQCITELRSLKYDGSRNPFAVGLPEFLEVCSGSLNKLDITVVREILPNTPRKYPKLQLEQLIVRTEMLQSDSRLPEAVIAINSISSPRHLILDIDICFDDDESDDDDEPDDDNKSDPDLSYFDFSPIALLATISPSISSIDIYVHTGVIPSTLMHSQLMSSLGNYEDVVRLIEEGVLVIHSEKTAPD